MEGHLPLDPRVSCAVVVRAPELRDRRVILVDLLGFGFSDRPRNFSYSITDHARVLADAVDRLKIDEFDVYGHSMGGTIAIVLASLLPGKTQSLIVSEPNLDSGGGTFSRAIAHQSEAQYVETGHELNIRSAIQAGNLVWAGTMRVADPIAVHRSARSLVQGQTPSWRSTLLGLKLSRTVIFGEQSLPDPDYERLQQDGIVVRVVPEAGHSMALENPLGLSRAISGAGHGF